ALGDDAREHIEWLTPFAESVEILTRYQGRAVAVLATGDPMWFGAGSTLVRTIPLSEMRIIPAPSAFSLAAARLGWPLDEVDCLTVHGRPMESVLPFIVPGAKLLIYGHDGETPKKLAALLRERGFGDSDMIALSHLGGAEEAVCRATALNWAEAVPSLTTLAIACVAAADATILSTAPGLPDEAYLHDGQLTKREVRAATLAALAPLRNQLLWDVGAGCGSIGIEWCRAAKGARACAFESNALALGVPDLDIVEGQAPDILTGRPGPDAIFIGGGLSADGMVDRCWAALKPGGRLVANAVTIEGEQRLAAAHQSLGGELIRLAISRAGPVGDFTGWRPLMPVTQLRVSKS
ncbi:MAG: precorrin-6y C5,15-methyltransferase (decarboxylating) subunit CbiE, partial [Proteobacteria bacterium]|nr:precorrin-6y C5,15-methyltransferase (decarboxylating) subunit CbiE [Pseudomonadota bacterium]